MVKYWLGILGVVWMILVGLNLSSAEGAEFGVKQSTCVYTPPVLELSLGDVLLESKPQDLGSWYLRVSPDDEESPMTYAQVKIRLVPIATELWALDLKFGFEDPEPYGLPYVLQKAAVTWIDLEGMQTQSLDWSGDCTGPGRSFFNGQGFDSRLLIPGKAQQLLKEFTFRLWGGRPAVGCPR